MTALALMILGFPFTGIGAEKNGFECVENTSSKKSTMDTEYSWCFGQDVILKKFNGVDMDPSIVRDGKKIWFIYGGGGVDHRRIRRWQGSNMDDLTALPDGKRDDSFTRPFGDDIYWIGPIWVDPANGDWLATVHVEFHYDAKNPWGVPAFRRIGLAKSIDKGANWHYEGSILTSDNPLTREAYAGHYYDNGEGDLKLYVDAKGGYFYLWFLHDWCKKDAGWTRVQSMRVARCALADKMAPGKWQKWYHGRWSESGLGGHSSDVFNSADNTTVFFSTFLNRFAALGSCHGGDYLSTCDDLSKQNWSPMEQLGVTNQLGWYNFAVNPTNWQRMEVGQEFRLYSSQCGSEGFDTRYRLVRFTFKDRKPVLIQPTYPDESVPDFNPIWDSQFK